MFVFLALLLIVILVGISFKNYKGIDNEALSRDRTMMINGIFVVLIIFSHFNSYVTYTSASDQFFYKLITQTIGQLMVTTFFFYSGYGILESIKKKKDYIKTFFTRRILKLFISFSIAIFLYLILAWIIKADYSIKTILLSFVGLESVGNSNWFIFAIFCMYFATLISFNIFKKDHLKGILLSTILSLVYIGIIRFYRYSFWYDTVLCYNLGMYISYYKDSILKFLKDNVNYILSFIILAFSFFAARLIPTQTDGIVFELQSICFVLMILLITLKIKIGNKVLLFIGKNAFNIYILQRLVFISYDKLKVLDYNIYIYFIASILTLFILVFIFDKILKIIYKRLKIA